MYAAISSPTVCAAIARADHYIKASIKAICRELGYPAIGKVIRSGTTEFRYQRDWALARDTFD